MVRRLLVAVLALAAAGCGPQVDLKKSLQVTDLLGGYYDAGVVEGRNKIVPSITFSLHKNTSASIHPLQLTVYFRKLPVAGTAPEPGTNGETDWEDVFIQNVDFHGDTTAPLTVRPKVGYTGDPPQTRADMLKNSHFQDVRVHIFAKHSSSQWIEIGTFDLPRQLLMPQH
jgi:hypothetical protein